MAKSFNDVVVFGGGTAGWLTALWAKKFMPQSNITLIESATIGILGAGEGTVPGFMNFLRMVEIDPIEMISRTRGSVKLGISFDNWNGDGKNYFHNFCEFSDRQLNTLCDEDKVPFYMEGKNLIQDDGNYALHFDAHKLALYLREKAESRGVKRVEGIAVDFKVGNGVESILLKDGQIINCDFVFDCSGFARMIIGGVLKSRWISYDKHLPMKKAIPYFPKQDENRVIPYTRAIAMKYGWQWQIPLMDRFGAGYVFDSDYITPDQAKDELDQWVGYEVDCPRVIDFNAGRFENVWINNCVAVGLSSGFIEPLEATAIWTATETLVRFGELLPHLSDDPRIKEKFNEQIGNSNDNTLCFLYYHYLTKRDDSPFWKEFRQINEPPEKLKPILAELSYKPIDNYTVGPINANSTTRFELTSYMQVGLGLGLLIDPFTNYTYRDTSKYLTHKEFLELISTI